MNVLVLEKVVVSRTSRVREVKILVTADVVVSGTLWLAKVSVLILGVKEKQWKL